MKRPAIVRPLTWRLRERTNCGMPRRWERIDIYRLLRDLAARAAQSKEEER